MLMIFGKERKKGMKSLGMKIKKFLEEEASEEYNGDTLGMYIGGIETMSKKEIDNLLGGQKNE